MSEKTYEIRGLMDLAEILHVEIHMFVSKENVFCGNGGTTVLKVTLAMCANLLGVWGRKCLLKSQVRSRNSMQQKGSI